MSKINEIKVFFFCLFLSVHFASELAVTKKREIDFNSSNILTLTSTARHSCAAFILNRTITFS